MPEERPTNAFDGDREPGGVVHLPTAASAPSIGTGEPVTRSTSTPSRCVTRLGGRVRSSRDASRITLDGSRDIDVTLPDGRAASRIRVPLDGEPFHQLEVTVLEAVGTASSSVGFSEIEIPGVDVEEWTVLPTAVLGLLSTNAANAPLAFILSRERANPAEPVRADPELSMRRLVDLPAPLALTLDGTATAERQRR